MRTLDCVGLEVSPTWTVPVTFAALGSHVWEKPSRGSAEMRATTTKEVRPGLDTVSSPVRGRPREWNVGWLPRPAEGARNGYGLLESVRSCQLENLLLCRYRTKRSGDSRAGPLALRLAAPPPGAASGPGSPESAGVLEDAP